MSQAKKRSTEPASQCGRLLNRRPILRGRLASVATERRDHFEAGTLESESRDRCHKRDRDHSFRLRFDHVEVET